jgi:hypothetical protein
VTAGETLGASLGTKTRRNTGSTFAGEIAILWVVADRIFPEDLRKEN